VAVLHTILGLAEELAVLVVVAMEQYTHPEPSLLLVQQILGAVGVH
jgi:hypothetical protein